MGAASWCRFPRAPEAGGRARSRGSRLLGAALCVVLAGCAGPRTAQRDPQRDPQLDQLQAEIRVLRAEVERLGRENQELKTMVDQLKAAAMDIELKRGRFR